MFVFLYTYVCMYVCMYVRMYVCMYVRMYVCMYVCMYVRMYECMYVCTVRSAASIYRISSNRGRGFSFFRRIFDPASKRGRPLFGGGF